MWHTLAFTGMIITLAWPTLLVPLLRERSGLHEDSSRLAVVVCSVLLTLIAAGANYALWQVYTPQFPTWLWWTLAGVFLVIMFGYFLLMEWGVHAAALLIVIAASAAFAIIGLIHALDPNPYRVTHGRVIEHSYTEPDPDEGYAEQWLLLVEQCDAPKPCVRGWLYFNQNVWDLYPVGSTYPGP